MIEQSTSNEFSKEVYKPEKFLEALYDRVENWVADQDLTKLATFSSQRILKPGIQAGNIVIRPLPFDLKKAVIFRNDQKIFAMAFGRGQHSSLDYGIPPYRLQLVTRYEPGVPEDLDKEGLHFLTNSFYGPHYGDFIYRPSLKQLQIFCFLDKYFLGSEKGYYTLLQKRLFTKEDLDECLHLAKEIDRRHG